MKKTFLGLFLIFQFLPNLYSNCDQDIFLEGQAAVDAFPSEYGCSIVNGSLIICGDASDLSPLSSIVEIKGDLQVAPWNNWCESTNLTNFEGLEALQKIGGNLLIHGTGMESVDGLENLILTILREYWGLVYTELMKLRL